MSETSTSAPSEAVRAAADYPALAAIFGRRSRRFPLGGELTGPLAYRSRREPLSLDPAEEAVLVAAATGITGVARDEWAFRDADGRSTGGGMLASFTGRSFASPLANHSTELFWTNDDGVFVLPQRDLRPGEYIEDTSADGRAALYDQAVRLQDHRLDIPRRQPNLFAFNHQLINVPGSTVFIPISDVTRQCISAMLLYFDRPHGYPIADPRYGGRPLEPFIRSGFLRDTHPVDLWDFERWQMVDANGVEPGIMIANLGIATQALGLGGNPFSGGKGRVTMGGAAAWRAAGGTGPCEGLGFCFHEVPEGAPVGAGESIPVGLPGVLESCCPPFVPDMDAAVDRVVALRRGRDGTFSDTAERLTPWLTDEPVSGVPSPSDEAIECTKTLCRYIWDTYNRFPATIDPLLTTVWYQAHHLDTEFYDRYYPRAAVPDHIRDHLRQWHPGHDHA